MLPLCLGASLELWVLALSHWSVDFSKRQVCEGSDMCPSFDIERTHPLSLLDASWPMPLPMPLLLVMHAHGLAHVHAQVAFPMWHA